MKKGTRVVFCGVKECEVVSEQENGSVLVMTLDNLSLIFACSKKDIKIQGIKNEKSNSCK